MSKNNKPYSKIKEFMLYYDRRETIKDIEDLQYDLKLASKSKFELESFKVYKKINLKEEKLNKIENKIKTKIIGPSFKKFSDLDPFYEIDYDTEMQVWIDMWDNFMDNLTRKEKRMLYSGIDDYTSEFKDEVLLKESLAKAPDTSDMKPLTFMQKQQEYNSIVEFFKQMDKHPVRKLNDKAETKSADKQGKCM